MFISFNHRNYISISLLCVMLILTLIPVALADIESQGTGSDHWMIDSLVYDDASDEESWPSIATDSNGNLYVAYQHYDSGFERYRIYISKSTDGGLTWILFYTIQKTTSLLHPSITIDPFDDRIYVAYENEISSNAHEILISRYTPDEGWAETTVIDSRGLDDRYPCIVSDYQFGPGNNQYLSYETVQSYNNRDLHVHRSTDHGSTWPIWHDWYYGFESTTTRAQTSITVSQDGHVYVAYVFGTTYDGQKDLCIQYGDRASESNIFENQLNLGDQGIPSGVSWPSVCASHYDANIVLITFQRYVTSTNDDVCYTFTNDGGTNWYWGNISATGYNERYPTVTVDGQGSTSYVDGYFRVAYYYGLFTHYKQAYYSTPWSWSEYPGKPNPISSESGTGANDQDRSIAITTQKDGDTDSWWPNVLWTDNRGSSYDLFSTTPGNNPIIPEFPSLIIIPLFMISTLLVIIVYRRKRFPKLR